MRWLPPNPVAVPVPGLAGQGGRSVLCLSFVAALALGCSPSKAGAGPHAQSPERQSEAEYDVARDLFHKGNPRAALDHVHKAIELSDENDKAHYFAAAIYLDLCNEGGFEGPDCRMAEAERHTRAALKANPDFRDAKNMLGQVLIHQKRYKDAIAVLEPLSKDPAYTSNHLAWGNLGWAQVLDGQLDAGITSLRNSITQPQFCVGHYRLGVAYEKRGDLANAETSFGNAVSVESDMCKKLQDAWEGRARVRMKLGKIAEAREDYEKCRELSSETATGKICVKQLGTIVAPASAPGGGAPSGTGGATSAPTGSGGAPAPRQ